MITNETYQDIQILQNHNFQNVITFDATHTMTNTMSYAAVISKDKSHTAFTGPSKTTGTNGTRGNSDAWQSASVTKIYFDVIADRSAKTVTLSLPAEATKLFTDDFEGVWDLVEKETSTNPDEYVRQIQGDVVVSASVTETTDTFTASIA